MERRKNPRISSRIRVEFVERELVKSFTANVSRDGIFVQGETGRAMNVLVRMRLFLPPEQTAIEVFGRVAWIGSVDRVKGIGIHFLEIASAERDRWLRFVSLVEKLEAGVPIREAAPQSAKAKKPDDERRRAPRTQSSFLVRFKDRESLESFVTRNLSEGGMFLATPVLKPVGTRIQVVMVHPTKGTDFEVDAEVVRTQMEDSPEQPKGMGLKFVSLEKEDKEELKKFIQS